LITQIEQQAALTAGDACANLDGDLTEGFLLDGTIRYCQPRHGFRSGIEPVLLAASIPAAPGERVLEGGSGAGAGLLCLAARVAGITGTGIECDASLVRVARRNASDNGRAELQFMLGDVALAGGWPQRTQDAGGHAQPALDGPFDHAFANPPYHAPSGTTSPHAGREIAKRRQHSLLAHWATALASMLRHRGSLSFILPAEALPEALDAMRAAGCGAPKILPLWPKAGRQAKLLVVQTVKGGRSPMRLLSGLTLHEADGRFTSSADEILRAGAPLRFH
jgi:tRNA1Val (adenine37-N6)-methyltransferase